MVKGTPGHSHGTNFCTNYFHSICIAFWPIRLLLTTFCSQNKISLPYLMITILLHKLKLNEKRCLLNKSCSILCPNDGNISLVYGGSFVGYLQRDNCALCGGTKKLDKTHYARLFLAVRKNLSFEKTNTVRKNFFHPFHKQIP